VAAKWEHFAHKADIGLCATATDKAAVFEQMAFAMTAAITELDRIDPVEEVIINCEAPNDEILLIDWLNAIVYEMATRSLLFGEFKVSLQDHTLRGLARGEPVNASKHHPAVEVKGATYTALEVTQTDDGQWKAQCIIDV
jgi:tRNA nucleotidyltransferase (CCA-adding enzyme)